MNRSAGIISNSFFLLLFFLLASPCYAQLTGLVTDENEEPLPFANVYVKGTSRGTTTNLEGNYRLELEPGNYTVIFHFLGYKMKEKEVVITSGVNTMDVQLFPEAYQLKEVQVEAEAEDPAYRVIRNAIEKRKYYKELIQAYSCEAYVKGMQKMKDAPEKILGQEVGNMGGALDTNRQGIIYLSESESEIFYRAPDQKKEVMISSRVSGDDNGFSFNRASLMDFSFYENSLDILRPLVSPIANTALSYYRYKLLGTFVDNEGRLVNRIQVIPKRKDDPVFAGYINIVEDLWLIQSVDLFITGKTIRQPILDTLYFQQTHLPVEEPDKWMVFSQTLDFDLGIFGFKIGGYFTGVFSHYNLQPGLEEDFFKGEIFRVRDSANLKPLDYWAESRPIPLTREENADYIRKDSLQKIWNSREYRDSMDRVSNKFSISNLFFGYSYNKSSQRYSIDISSPLNSVQFNAVQGWLGTLEATIRKDNDDEKSHWYSIRPYVSYGFSDEQIRGGVQYLRQLNAIQYPRLSIEAGRAAVQFNEENPISPMVNQLYSLFGKDNYMRIYDKTFGEVKYGQEIFNGLRVTAGIAYAERTPLQNTTSYSFRREDEPYFPNTPLAQDRNEEVQPGFAPHEAMIFNLSLRLRINQKYSTYPKRRSYHGSDWPVFRLNYQKGMNVLGSLVNFDRLSLEVSDNWSVGLGGSGSVFLQGGTFLNDEQYFFMDQFHFNGNQTIIGNPSDYLRSFFLLPYYEFSTTRSCFQLHWQHRFQGFLLDKLPLIRKLGWQSCIGAKWLQQQERKGYFEVAAGLDNIGFGIFRIFRVDYAWAFQNGNLLNQGWMIGLRL